MPKSKFHKFYWRITKDSYEECEFAECHARLLPPQKNMAWNSKKGFPEKAAIIIMNTWNCFGMPAIQYTLVKPSPEALQSVQDGLVNIDDWKDGKTVTVFPIAS